MQLQAADPLTSAVHWATRSVDRLTPERAPRPRDGGRSFSLITSVDRSECVEFAGGPYEHAGDALARRGIRALGTPGG